MGGSANTSLPAAPPIGRRKANTRYKPATSHSCDVSGSGAAVKLGVLAHRALSTHQPHPRPLTCGVMVPSTLNTFMRFSSSLRAQTISAGCGGNGASQPHPDTHTCAGLREWRSNQVWKLSPANGSNPTDAARRTSNGHGTRYSGTRSTLSAR